MVYELMKPDSTIMPGGDIERFAALHNVPIPAIAGSIEWHCRECFAKPAAKPGTDGSA
jgi:hypothetical protein